MTTLTDFRAVLETVFYIVGIVSMVLALLTYRRNATLERLKWMTALYDKFYESPHLKPIRDTLDAQRQDDAIERDGE